MEKESGRTSTVCPDHEIRISEDSEYRGYPLCSPRGSRWYLPPRVRHVPGACSCRMEAIPVLLCRHNYVYQSSVSSLRGLGHGICFSNRRIAVGLCPSSSRPGVFEPPPPRAKWLRASIAVLVLVGALAIYQPAAMIFWVFAAVFLFRPGPSLNDAVARFLYYGLVGLVGMGLGFVLYKLPAIFYSETSRGDLAWNFLEKAVFLYELMPRILNFALLAPRRSFYQGQGYSIQDYSILYARTFDDSIITLFLLSFIIAGLVMFFRSSRIERFLKCLMALSIFLFCCTPFRRFRRLSGADGSCFSRYSLSVLRLSRMDSSVLSSSLPQGRGVGGFCGCCIIVGCISYS